jgi:hypothetical protein
MYANVPFYRKVMACDSFGACGPMSARFVHIRQANVNGWSYVYSYYRTSPSTGDYISLTYISLMPYNLALALHITNGSSASSPHVTNTLGRDPTDCTLYNTISFGQVYTASSFTSGKVGTLGHTVLSPTQCGTGDAGDSTDNQWGDIPPP